MGLWIYLWLSNNIREGQEYNCSLLQAYYIQNEFISGKKGLNKQSTATMQLDCLER